MNRRLCLSMFDTDRYAPPKRLFKTWYLEVPPNEVCDCFLILVGLFYACYRMGPLMVLRGTILLRCYRSQRW
jgi:hypothetical protein